MAKPTITFRIDPNRTSLPAYKVEEYQNAVNEALKELDAMFESGEPSGFAVVQWFVKWKDDATYKYLGKGVDQWYMARSRG